MAKILNLSDNFCMNDTTSNKASHPQTLWARTQILGGYGKYINESGVSDLKEIVFEESNIVPIGGVQFAMEQIFGAKGSIEIPKLNDVMQIGAQESNVTPSNGMPYPYGQRVCLFGVGTGGAAENNITVLKDKYNEYIIPDMIPFRFSSEELSEADRVKYFGKKEIDDVTAYYLKKFDSEPVIRHVFKNGEDGEDGSEVDATYFNSATETGVSSFTESCLTINKKDIREWFKYNGNIEDSRVNTIGLFSAVYDSANNDYANIQLFSKLNIPTEPLSLTKDMNIIYRVYGA